MVEDRVKFWMVWSPQGRAPVHKHTTRAGAFTEASRLAKANPGSDFYVMKAVGGATAGPPPISRIKMVSRQEDDRPF